MEMNERKAAARRASEWRRSRRWNAGLSLLLSGVVAFLLHALAIRHHVRADWSRAGFYRLSPKTTGLLDALETDIEVAIVLKAGHPDLQDIVTLLREYQSRSPRIRVSRVDPDRDPARLEELAKRFPITEPNVVVFAAEGRARVIAESDWIELEPDNPGQPPKRSPRRRAFRGEAAFSSAIHALTRGERPVVYFLEGFGEKSLDSSDPALGLSRLERTIRQDNIVARSLRLEETGRIPPDAAALIVAGPRRRLPQPALDVIHAWLDAGGRAIFLLDSRVTTGLEDLLARWGVRVGNDVVLDPARTLTGLEVIVGPYDDHPITQPLGRYAAVFYRPRSVEPASGNGEADRPRAVRLAATTARGWAETDFETRPSRFDAGQDRPGPIGVAVAVERGAAPALDVQLRPTRLVVFGDSQFVANSALAGANGDFFMNALHWLVGRPELMAIAPKPIEEARLNLTRRQMRLLSALAIAGWPAAFALISAAVRLRRRQ